MLARAFALVGIIAIAACAGVHGLPNITPVPATSDVEQHATTIVQGTIKVNAWIVPAGKTWSVGPKGVAVSAKTITINGTLQVGSGRRLVLLAPILHINGQITSASSGTTRTVSATVSDVIGACSLQVGTSKMPIGLPLAIPPGDRLYVAATGTACTFDIYGYLITSAGRNGSPKIVAVRAGETGGSIDIGTAAANTVTQAAAKHIGVSVKAHTVQSLAVEGAIAAGYGGDGAADSKGKFDTESDTWSFNAGGGAPGGDVSLQAHTFAQLGTMTFTVAAGRGGNGGGIGTAKLDGTPTAPNGGSLSIVESEGGRGGVVRLTGTQATQLISVGGSGGNAGAVSAAAGDGWSLLGGHGGNISLTLAKPGPGGVNADSLPAANGSYPVMAFGGGNGGSGAIGAVGGPGGSFDLTRPSPAPALPPSAITFYGFNGGGGGNNCTSVGLAGGAGGNFSETASDSDFEAIFVNGYLFSAFGGGPGGSGVSGGLGGAAGKASFNGAYVQPAGTTGGPGGGC